MGSIHRCKKETSGSGCDSIRDSTLIAILTIIAGTPLLYNEIDDRSSCVVKNISQNFDFYERAESSMCFYNYVLASVRHDVNEQSLKK